MGLILDYKGEYDSAIEYFQKALEINLNILGPEHLNVSTDYITISKVYQNMRDYNKAAENHKKALKIYQKVFGPDHPDTKRVQKELELLKENTNSS